MISATIPSIRSMLFFFDGFQLSAASVSIDTFPAIQRRTGLPAVAQLPGEDDFLQLLGRRVHAGVALPEGDHLEPVPVELRGQLRGVPAVDADLADVVTARPAR